MPDCKDKPDKCQCHPSYTGYKDIANEQNKLQRNCLKTFSEKKSWDMATQTCVNEFSVLANYRLPNSFLQGFRNRGVGLIWIGIRKRLGFYTVRAPVEYVFKPWSSTEVAREWEAKEPIHECVAFNIYSASVVTRNCTTELEYVCENFGFPVYPVSKSLACPKEWLFFYQRKFGKSNCIKLFQTRGRNATATCLELGSQVADLRDFLDLYNHTIQLNISGTNFKYIT
ncbi:hypothetical protein AVEN_80606-1 [Araneus ventricosus]|uniref:C-type lectin domain-containing protein n=1 Tax=Araneus ventricosus TaxID=182803 RepID=A0A4Y2KAP2_ARAVE|nr:hypothetical protein AVEN_80606-1 [Araneus ventricosus]